MVGAEVMGWAWSSSWVGVLSPWSSPGRKKGRWSNERGDNRHYCGKDE